MKRFNVTGNCIPEEDYMVDIGGKIAEIKKLIDSKYYFTINRARQYGKTTTLAMLERNLKDDYAVASISFQGIGDNSFDLEENFCLMVMELIQEALKSVGAEADYARKWVDEKAMTFVLLSRHITKMCEDKKVVLMIDEVDRTSNNRVFLHFIGMLRDKFLLRERGKDYTFHSVILAGVYDIKNIKLKLINQGLYKPTESENKVYNSPWNIAVNFTVDMSFCPADIATMLGEYEADHETGMDIAEMSEEIYSYTSGYPFLVSRICQCIDEELDKNWSADGVREAVKILLVEQNTLFDDIFKNLENNKELHDFIYGLLIVGETGNYTADDPIINIGLMFGFLKKDGDKIGIANKIFEIRMTNYYISKESRRQRNTSHVLPNDVIKSGRFDMELCLCKFAEHYSELFNKTDIEFLERHGRLLFLMYLRPLINGGGFYHIESQLTDLRRMDIVVDYGRDQFIIELKLWRGKQYKKMCNECERSSHAVHTNRLAYEQLLDYMKIKKADKGYLLTFDFRKEKTKKSKTEWVALDGKKIFEVIV